MRYVLMTEPQQGMSFTDQLAIAQRAEASGIEAFFRSDHFASFPRAGLPTTDAWTVLAGIARETAQIGLGVLVSPVTFRHPGVLAKVVTTVDEMAAGRVEVGVGAGWNRIEHEQLGVAFPPIKKRADLLEDQLAVLHGLWGEPDGWSYTGVTGLQLTGALFRPRPVEVSGRPSTPVGGSRPRIILGGQGTPRSYRLAARYADEFNLSSASPERAAFVSMELDEACREIGRNPASLDRSVMVGILLGRTRREVDNREQALLMAIGPESATSREAWLEERRTQWLFGQPDEAREQAARYKSAGIHRLVLQDFLPWDLKMVDAIGEELVRSI